MQDDPCVVDLWWEDVNEELVGEREEAVLITRADHWVQVKQGSLTEGCCEGVIDSQGRMFLYLFLLLFSGLCPSSLLFFTFASNF